MAQQDPGQRGSLALSGKLICIFSLTCALLAAIGGYVFLALGSVEILDRAEAFSSQDEVAVLHAMAKDADLLQAETLFAVATDDPAKKAQHVALVARMQKKNADRLQFFETINRDRDEDAAVARLQQKEIAFSAATRNLLLQSRAPNPLTIGQIAPQLLAYAAYQKSLGEVTFSEEAKDRAMISATSQQIAQTKNTGDILLAVALLLGLLTGYVLFRMVSALRKDRNRLATEVQQREKASTALAESEERYRALLDRIPDAICVICEEEIVFANPAAQKLLAGNSADSVVGQKIGRFHLPDESRANSPEDPAEKTPTPTERQILRLDGTVAEVETHSIPSVFQGRSARQIIIRNLTEKKAVEERLRAQERQYRLLFEDNPSPMWVYDPKTLHFLAVNEAAITHYGFSRDEFLGRTLKDIRPNDQAPRFVTALNQPDTLTEYGGIWQHRKKDGTPITVALHSSPIDFDGVKARLATAFDITDRVERERKLREREASLALAQHVAGVGSWEYQIGPDGRVEEDVFWSAEVFHILGKLPEHFRPSRPAFFQPVHPADRARVALQFRQFQDKGGRLTVEYRIILPNGYERVVAVAAEVITSGEDKHSKVIGTIMDITEQVSKAQALQKAEERYRAIFANATDGIFQSTPGGQFLVVNPAAARIFGYGSPEEMVRERVDITRQSYVNPRRRYDFIEEIERNGVVNGFECEVFRRDGSKVWISENARAVRDTNGKTLYFEGTLVDISQRKRAEERVREQAELLNLAHDAIMVRDMEDRIEFWNHGAEALYGWTATEVRGRSSAELFYGSESPEMAAARETLLRTGTWSGEMQHLTKDGHKVTVRGRWSLLRDEFGKPKSKLVINTDITAQKRFEEQFLRTQRLESIGTLASGIAHDLNNVLLPVLMAAPILRKEQDPEERNKFLDIVEASAKRGASIVRQVVTFARGADGEHMLIQPLYLLQEIAKIAAQTFPKAISIRTHHGEDLRSLEADPTQLHQILLNLCINARDAMPNGGTIALSAENFDVDRNFAEVTPEAKAGPHVLLQVSDTGSGIPAEVMDKIFDPFFTTKGIGQGTGLGLSTVAGIVRSHGGFIRVYSEPGSTIFKVYLPAKDASSVAADAATEAPPPRGHGETILLVDDEAGIRRLAEAILLEAGYNVILADDGPAALALFARHAREIALVLTDIAMPVTNGIVLARALRKTDPRIRIILSTGRNDDLNTPEITAMKLNGLLRKPYTRRDLLVQIAQTLAATDAPEPSAAPASPADPRAVGQITVART